MDSVIALRNKLSPSSNKTRTPFDVDLLGLDPQTTVLWFNVKQMQPDKLLKVQGVH